jgi:purine-binding chemotaxis protein CheW
MAERPGARSSASAPSHGKAPAGGSAPTVAGLSLATEEAWHRRGTSSSAPQRDFLTVRVGDEEYGIDILRIREIIKPRLPTEVPRAPSFVSGVISVRGVVMPVLDLRVRLGLGAAVDAPPGNESRRDRSRILIVTREDELIGLRVDEVRQVVRLGDDEVEPPPPMLGGAEADFVHGIGRTRSARMVILIALDAILRFEVAGRRRGEEAR